MKGWVYRLLANLAKWWRYKGRNGGKKIPTDAQNKGFALLESTQKIARIQPLCYRLLNCALLYDSGFVHCDDEAIISYTEISVLRVIFIIAAVKRLWASYSQG